MNLLPYIFGLIGSVSTIIVVLLNQWTGWEIHSLSIWFIIPVGGILLGMGGAGGFFLGRKLTNTKMYVPRLIMLSQSFSDCLPFSALIISLIQILMLM